MQQQINFNKDEKEPNEKQKECINFKNGIRLALAGPGTGKTFSISRRIKSLIENNIAPEKILCMTFTDVAANEMRKAVSKILDEPTAQKINIFTYHSLCLDIIENNKDEFSDIYNDNLKIMKDTAKYKLMKECIDELEPTANRDKKNNPYSKIKNLIDDISEIKKNLIDKDTFFENIKNHPNWGGYIKKLEEKKEEYLLNNKKVPIKTEKELIKTQERIEKANELWNIYELYENKKAKHSLIDFDDMLTFVANKFEQDEEFIQKIASCYLQILVDEYQDTSKIQNKIIFNLIDNMQEQNAFVVGDDDQTIFSFQGAHIDNIEKFIEKYSNSENFDVICLEENRRSTENILNFSYEVSKLDPMRLEGNPKFEKYNINKKLKAKNESLKEKNKLPIFTEYVSSNREINATIEKIEQIINSSECPKENNEKKLNEIAILTKNNDELKIYAEKLKAKNIPFELKEGKDIFETKSATTLYLYLKLIADPAVYEENLFKILLTEPFNFNKDDYIYLWNLRHKNNDTLFIDDFKTLLKEQKSKDPEKIENFIKTYENIKELMTSESLRTTVLSAAQKTGIYNYFVNTKINKTENISALKTLLDIAYEFSQDENSANLKDFLDYLDLSRENGYKIKTEKPPISLNAIQLSTYHSSKGREFEYVFMPNLKRSNWESNNKSTDPKIPVNEVLDEEKKKNIKKSNETKLMYVGLTRAKHTLYLSCAQDNKLGITEIIKPLLSLTDFKTEEFDTKLYENDLIKELEQKDFDYSNEFNTLIKTILSEISYSPSSINTYIECPRQYLYSYILKLDTKSEFRDEANYGTAMHYALQVSCNFAKENKNYPDKEYILKNFKKKFDNLIISDKNTRKFMEQRAQKSIDAFYPQFISTPIDRIVGLEYFIKNTYDGIKISGIIDRIELNDDETYTIADYKTGYNKKQSDVKIKGKYQKYLIQLILYKIFFEKINSKKVTKLKIILPDDCQNTFEINFDEGVEKEVLEIFKAAHKNINNLKFEKNQNKDSCKYCSFKDLCTAKQ